MITLHTSGPRPYAEIELASRRLTLEVINRAAGICRLTVERRGADGPEQHASMRVYGHDLRVMIEALEAIEAPASTEIEGDRLLCGDLA